MAADFLPVTPQPGVPLRVEVYDRIARAVLSGALAPETLLPTESELGDAMAVSRTVVREALLLLEEDGFLRSRRGIGRVIAIPSPATGFEHLRPLEDLLAERYTVLTVRRTEMTLQRTSASFVTEGLGIDPTSPSLFIESVLLGDGSPVAIIQEHVPANSPVPGSTTAVREVVETLDPERTFLGWLVTECGPALGPGGSEITAGTPGRSRSKLLGVDAASPVLIVTQSMRRRSESFYLAKLVLRPEAGPLRVSHTAARGYRSR